MNYIFQNIFDLIPTFKHGIVQDKYHLLNKSTSYDLSELLYKEL